MAVPGDFASLRDYKYDNVSVFLRVLCTFVIKKCIKTFLLQSDLFIGQITGGIAGPQIPGFGFGPDSKIPIADI